MLTTVIKTESGLDYIKTLTDQNIYGVDGLLIRTFKIVHLLYRLHLLHLQNLADLYHLLKQSSSNKLRYVP